MVTVVIPLKALSDAKGRLAGSLAQPQRREFVAWMAGRVIAACLACDAVDDVLVVAGDDDAAAVARDRGVRAVVVDQPGLAAALGRADLLLRDRAATLVVAADLPEVTAPDLHAVIAAAGDTGPAVVIAPTHDGGTGAMLRRPPGVIATAYGPDSAAEHLRRAAEAGAHVAVVRREGLARDVDTPDQLPAALALAAQHDVGCGPGTSAVPPT